MAKKKLKEFKVNRDWCKGCSICVAFCPKSILELDQEERVMIINPDECICCRLCEFRCPDLAIQLLTTEEDDS